MVSVYDVPAEKLILAVAEDLKKKVKEPDYTLYIKTGVSKDRAPDQQDWWYVRMAAVLRKFYTKEALGTELLRGYFGSLHKRGCARPHFEKASGKVIRDCVQNLEKLGYLEKAEKGRKITAAGRKYVDGFASKIGKEAK